MRQGSTPSRIVLGALMILMTQAHRAGADEGWTLPDKSRGHRVAPILLLSRPEVRADLHLKPDQATEAGRVIASIHGKAAQLRGRNDAAAVELRRAVDDEQRTWLETRLTEDQVGRLSEIDLQWEGIAAVATRPGLGEALSLSDSQKQSLGRLVAERQAHRAQPAERRRDPEAAERQFAHQAQAILNEGQRRRWERMIGRPLALATIAASAEGHAAR